MNKVALLLPSQEMCDIASTIVGNYNLDIVTIETVQDSTAAERASELVEQGVEIILARGFQAVQIRLAVSVPVVQIRITTQELGLLIRDIKNRIGLSHPRISVIALSNLLQDTSHYSEIFDADIQIARVAEAQDYPMAVDRAVESKVDAVIGGRRVYQLAQEHNIPAAFLNSGVEGIANAMAIAQNISYAMTLEKQNTARMQTLLDYAFEGIIQVNTQGVIQNMNTTMERLVGKKDVDFIGKQVAQVLPGLEAEFITAALRDGTETFGRPMTLPNAEVMLNIAPVRSGENVDGAILTFLESASVQKIGSKLRQNLYQRGHVSRRSFDNIIQNSKTMRDVVASARNIAKYDVPLLLTGENGAGKALLARCIHTESTRRENGFLFMDCAGYSSETLDARLFGSTNQDDSELSMVELAQDGTLYLNNVEALSPELQYKIYLLTQGQFYRNGQNRAVNLNVRVVAATCTDLPVLVQQKKFNGDLYYALSVLALEIPPLRQHREDIVGWVDLYMDRYRKQYNRYIHLNQSTYDLLRGYHWPGNLHQVKCLCERIVLLSTHRTADTVFVRRQLEQIYPDIQPETNRIVVYKDHQAVEIAELLKKYNGNREKVAGELGISKTTLWRKMKKFGIASDFSV